MKVYGYMFGAWVVVGHGPTPELALKKCHALSYDYPGICFVVSNVRPEQ